MAGSLAQAVKRSGGGLLAQRAVWEATAEALCASPLRVFFLGELAKAAIWEDDFDAGEKWLARMDPHSPSLLAESCFRSASVLLASRRGDHARVVELLGRAPAKVPIHASCREMVSIHQADALENLGDVDGAVAVLTHELARRHSAIVSLTRNLGDSAETKCCRKSFPLARDRALVEMLDRVPDPWGERAILALLLGSMMLVVGVVMAISGDLSSAAVAAPLGAIGAIAGSLVLRATRKKRMDILRGARPVRGRALQRTHVGGDDYVFELLVEAPGMPEQRVTTRLSLSAREAAVEHEGRAFEALWNPDHPTIFPSLSFTVTIRDLERGEQARSV